MAWRYGIPDVDPANHFVYFSSLLEDSQLNTRLGLSRKKEVGESAQIHFREYAEQLNTASEDINAAVTLIQSIAQSERRKELAVIQNYYKKLGSNLPETLSEYLNQMETTFAENPANFDSEGFYTLLTSELNKIRKGLEDYKEDLQRIKHNSETKTNLSEYAKDDYRIRLGGDVTSLLKKLNGTFRESASTEQALSRRIAEITVEIVQEKLGSQAISGEDFSAIVTAVFADILKKVQDIFDKTEGAKDLTEIIDKCADEIKDKYLEEITSADERIKTATQKALSDTTGADFERITRNVKNIMGIKVLDEDSEAYKKQQTKIQENLKAREAEGDAAKTAISSIRNGLDEKLASDLYKITFTSQRSKSSHGNLFELVQSLLEQGATKVGNSAATDLLSVTYDFNIGIDEEVVNKELEAMAAQMDGVIDKHRKETANNRDLRESIRAMNDALTKSVNKLEKLITELGTTDPEKLFIFHESLKLYTSVETKKSKSFSGREMIITSYIDYLLSGLEGGGIESPLNRDALIFLALNLSDLAVGGGIQDPLVKYFSIFAGLLMFDDVSNMAKEAVTKIKGEPVVQQVHLYNLNGIYVPASLVLTYVADVLNTCAKEVEYAATASINSAAANTAIKDWKIKWSEEKDGKESHPILGPAEWNEMGNAVASGTQVKIIFLSGFLTLIDKLLELA